MLSPSRDLRTTRRPALAPPWHVGELAPEEGAVAWRITAENYQSIIATTAAWDGPGTIAYEQGKTIAQVIAAAPELYEALQLARTYLQHYESDTRRAAWGDEPPVPKAPYQLQAVLLEVDAALRRARGQGW